MALLTTEPAHHQFGVHDRAFALPFYNYGFDQHRLHSIEQVETYLGDYIATTEHEKSTLINELLDYATSNLSIGVEAVNDVDVMSPTQEQVDALVFINDTIKAIRLAKNVVQTGHQVGDFL